MRRSAHDQVGTPLLAAVDVLGKAVLLLLLGLVVVDPTWANLEGKAPTLRALTYPLPAFALPVWWAARRPDRPYPWLSDLLLTFIGFTDILGNRLDLYDLVVWWDDWMHVANVTCVSAALVLLTMNRTASATAVLERSIAWGLSAALGWELYEYAAFVTRSSELPTAYVDTLGDLALGWLGCFAAALLVHLAWRDNLDESAPDRRWAVRG